MSNFQITYVRLPNTSPASICHALSELENAVSPSHAFCDYTSEEASAWASGFSAALQHVARLLSDGETILKEQV